MTIKWCPNHGYSKIIIKECEKCHHEWCPECTKQNAYRCPVCGANDCFIRIAKE
jgi:hypothetical protein